MVKDGRESSSNPEGSGGFLATEPIAVLGIFRGGTSSVATAVAKAGVYFGQQADLAPASDQNLAGNWELKDIQALNASILAAFGMNYFQASALPSNWPSFPGVSEMVADIRTTLRKHFNRHSQWGWKEPSTSILMPLYKAALAAEGVTPRYAICIRHPLSVAKSQRSRQVAWGYERPGDPSAMSYPIENRTIGLWVLYTLSSLKETQGAGRQVVMYDRFLESPRPYLERIFDGFERLRDSETIEAASEFVKPQWRHSQFTVDDLEDMPSIVSRVYNLCERIDADPDRFRDGGFDQEIDCLWDEWITTTQLVQPISLPLGQMFFTWQGSSGIERSVVYYSQTGDWQTIHTEINAPSGATIQLDLYQAPCQVWVRKATWHFTGGRADVMMKAGPNGAIENLGIRRLNVFGAGSLMIQAPKERPAKIELEIMVQTGELNLNMLIGMLRERLGDARREFAESFRISRGSR